MLKDNITIDDMDDSLDSPIYNMSALNSMMDAVAQIKKFKQSSVDALEAVLHHITSSKSEMTLKYYLHVNLFFYFE